VRHLGEDDDRDAWTTQLLRLVREEDQQHAFATDFIDDPSWMHLPVFQQVYPASLMRLVERRAVTKAAENEAVHNRRWSVAETRTVTDEPISILLRDNRITTAGTCVPATTFRSNA